MDDAWDVLHFAENMGDAAKTTGQWHHVFSRKIMRTLDEHPTLQGVFSREDFLVQAADDLSHRGYQRWHRVYDDQVVEWLTVNSGATQDEFLDYLQRVYSQPEIRERFPNAVDVLRQAMEEQ
jgi:hypothetical protein